MEKKQGQVNYGMDSNAAKISFSALKAFKDFLNDKRTSEHANGLQLLRSVQNLAIPVWPFLLKFRAPGKMEKLHLSF